MVEDWTEIAAYYVIWEASEAQTFLQSAGIEVVLQGIEMNTFFKQNDMVGTTIRVCVPQNRAAEAIEVLIDHGLLNLTDIGPNKGVKWIEDIIKKLRGMIISPTWSLLLILWIIILVLLVYLIK